MPTNTRAQELVARLADIRDTIAVLTDQKTQLEEQLADTLGHGSHDVGDVKVTVRAGTRRFDAKKFEAAIPPDARPDLYKAAPDLAAVKRHYSPAELEQWYGEAGKASVIVK